MCMCESSASAVIVHRACDLNRHLCTVPHDAPVNLVCFHKQLIVDTVQIISLFLQQNFI